MVCWRLALDIISASLRELAVRGRFILSLAGWLAAGWMIEVRHRHYFLFSLAPMAVVALAVSRRFPPTHTHTMNGW